MTYFLRQSKSLVQKGFLTIHIAGDTFYTRAVEHNHEPNSRAHVFYILSQIQIRNSVRSVVQYQRIPLFLKSLIKDSFEIQGMIHSKLANKQLPSYETNQWKNWLKGHCQYHLSQIEWSRLILIIIKLTCITKIRKFFHQYELSSVHILSPE